MSDMEGESRTHITRDTMRVSGARVAMMMLAWKAFWTLVTSVVILVTRPAVEKRSMFAKVNLCTFSKSASRRFAARPQEASEPREPESTPMTSASPEHASITAPHRVTCPMSPAEMPRSMRIPIT